MERLVKVASIFIALGMTIFFCIPAVNAQPANSIILTRHNLSISGPGVIKSLFEKRICIFCHAPHKSRGDIVYLWNRQDSAASYTTYESSTLYSVIGQPTGSSKLCLSCHDGTIALGALVSEQQEIPFVGGLRFFPDVSTKLGTDLSDDHPISFPYDSTLASNNIELVQPLSLPPQIKLDGNQQMQCTSCHDPHDNTYDNFLVMPNDSSALCITCHIKTDWNVTSHSTSNAMWNGSGTNPWPNSIYHTVSENGCENCHSPHNAAGHERLLMFMFEEDNCLVCHNGNVATTDIAAELTKTYTHPVQNYTNEHDPLEDFASGLVPTHVECSDCHNPHRSNTNTSPGAPQVSGATFGTPGINTSGQMIPVAANQYEICYKCHADNNVLSTVPIARVLAQLNTQLEFNSLNPSFHPVETQGANSNVPSLILPLTSTSIIFCSDCHNNDNFTGPKGLHGSNNQYLLEENYTTQDFTIESSASYALCYKCHDRASILGDNSFSKHNLHIVTANTPCSACHDAHGISSTQGNSTNNSHLINFDITIVQTDSQGRRRFEDTGTLSGQCFLSCHGNAHEPRVYP